MSRVYSSASVRKHRQGSCCGRAGIADGGGSVNTLTNSDLAAGKSPRKGCAVPTGRGQGSGLPKLT